jgi:hypothetical protein
MKIRLLFTAFLSIYSIQAQAIFTKMYKFEKPLKKGIQTIICCGDIHVRCADPNKAQEQLDAIIAQAKKCNAHIIAEGFDYAGNNQDIKVMFENCQEKKSLISPLYGIIDRCKEDRISFSNVEFRQAQIAFHGKCNLLKKTANRNQSNDEIMNLAIDPEASTKLRQTIKKVRSFKSEFPAFQEEYKKILDEVDQDQGKMDKMVKTLSQGGSPEQYNQLLNAIHVMGWRLIDAKILHELFVNRDKPYIIICAGVDHIKNIVRVLKAARSEDYRFTKLERKKEKDTFGKQVKDINQILDGTSAVNVYEFFNPWYSWAKRVAIACLCTGIICSAYSLYKWLRK